MLLLWKLWDDHSSNELHERMLHQAIEEKDYLITLGIEEWKIPLHSYQLKFTASTKTKIDILKKMIMHSMLHIKVTDAKFLSDFLRVDSLFIEDIIDLMIETGLVIKRNGTYHLTAVGTEQYEAGMTLSEPYEEYLSFQYTLLNKEPVIADEANVLIKENWELEDYRYADGKLTDLTGIVLEEEALRQYAKQSGAVFEIGGSEKVVSKIEPIELKETKFAKCIEFRLYDILADKVYTRVWNGALGRWDELIEDEINMKDSEQWKAEYEEAITNNFPERYKFLRSKLEELNNSNSSKKKKDNELSILRGMDIRERFIDSFAKTKEKMLMVSPWISSRVVDKFMLSRLQQFAKQNKTLYISWGIAKSFDREDRKPSEELLRKLKNIKHKDGTPAVFVRWLGNQHNKEIVVDNNYHLLGSFNWLSYRGDQDIRHESVVVINDKNVINDTTHYIEAKFIDALEKELAEILRKEAEDLGDSQLLDWMKELIMLTSYSERRIALSKKLVDFLFENKKEKLLHEIASLWVRYKREDFGVRSHLGRLLHGEQFDLAKEYFGLCKMNLPAETLKLWDKSPELKEHNEWLKEQLSEKKQKPQPEKKNKGKKKKK